jgi:transcriptional regulator with XRE-family HTH domain
VILVLDSCVIGERLKALRGGKKVEDVANALDISPSALSMYENGHRIPRDEIKVRIAMYYKTSIEAIFYAS